MKICEDYSNAMAKEAPRRRHSVVVLPESQMDKDLEDLRRKHLAESTHKRSPKVEKENRRRQRRVSMSSVPVPPAIGPRDETGDFAPIEEYAAPNVVPALEALPTPEAKQGKVVYVSSRNSKHRKEYQDPKRRKRRMSFTGFLSHFGQVNRTPIQDMRPQKGASISYMHNDRPLVQDHLLWDTGSLPFRSRTQSVPDRATAMRVPKSSDQVCHHPDCQDTNKQRPLMLCSDCDDNIHSGSNYTGHLRFDVFRKGLGLNRNTSTRSLPGTPSKTDNEEETSQAAVSAEVDEADGADENQVKKNTKLKRKKAVKGRRYHTEEKPSSHWHHNDNCTRQNCPSHLRSISLQDGDLSSNNANKRTEISTEGKTSAEASFQISGSDSESADESTNNRPRKLLPNGGSGDGGNLSQSDDGTGADSANETGRSDLEIGNQVRDTGQKNRRIIKSNTLDTVVPMGSENSESSTDDTDQVDWPAHLIPTEEKAPKRKAVYLSTSMNAERGRKISLPAKSFSDCKKEYPRKCSLGMEYFTLKFDILGESDFEIVAAVKGVSLKEAIRPALERRGVPLDSVNVHLASSNTPLPPSADCFPLGGNNLHVKRREMSRSTSTSSLVNKLKDKDKKPSTVYIKRNPSIRSTGAPSHTALDPPVVHKRLAQRPRSTGNLHKNEPHPLGRDTALGVYDDFVQGESKSKKSLVPEDGSFSNDGTPYTSVAGFDSLKSRGRGDKKKLPFTFGKQPPEGSDRQEHLQSLLNSYSLNGLPDMPDLLTIGQRPFHDNLLEIEKHWKDVVEVQGEMTKKQTDQQEAIWELLATEVKYIQNLKIIRDLFMCCLINLQNESLLNEIETEKLFCNISEVYSVNCEFWEDHLHKVLQHARDTKEHFHPSMLKDCFAKFEEIFKPYTNYCLEQKQSLDYIKDKYKENELFRTFVQWAEAQKQCNRLKLQDLVVMPMQRLTKYKLLLLAVHKKTDSEHERRELIQTIEKVDKYVIGVNTVLHQREEHERLAAIIERIESYDAIDAPSEECLKLVSEHCKLDLTCPVPGCGPQQRRHLLLEGGLKLKDASNSRTDVYCFLFTDMLLVTKPKRGNNKVKVIKPPMRLDKIIIHGGLKDPAAFLLLWLNEYHVASSVYTFHGEAKVWVDHIKKAQGAYRQLRQKALDQAEQRPYMYDLYEDAEDDFAIVNSPSMYTAYQVEHLPASRLDSVNSVDKFLPSLNLREGESEQRARLPSSVSFDEFRDLQDSDHRPRSITMSGMEIRRSRSPRPQNHAENGDLVMSRTDESPTPPGSPHLDPRRFRIGSSSDGAQPVFALRNRPDLIFINDEIVKTKLKRASRNERRYHTADAIQDINKDSNKENKDNSIQKRLSWNFGVDINIDGREAALKNKTFSSDSLRSMPSSSGVSSTGSLHFSPDSELCEDLEGEHEQATLRHSQSDSQVGETGNAHEDNIHVSSDASKLTFSVGKTGSVEERESPRSKSESGGLSSQISVSKSLPDISLQDREEIGGLELPRSPGPNGKQMSHAQIIRMKKQLLLSNTLEVSDEEEHGSSEDSTT